MRLVVGAQTDTPLTTDDGVKPPWNQPHEMPRAVSKSPMFRLVLFMPTTSVLLQSSNAGSGSPMTLPAMTSSFALFLLVVGPTPPVIPEITLIAPTVEGPKLVPWKLSLIAK